MKLLLDTHAALWWQSDDRRLGREARRAIAVADIVWVSAAAGWEVGDEESRRAGYVCANRSASW